MTFKAPFLRYEDIGEVTVSFLEQYHPSGEIPIPIEHIVEFQLGMDIVPMNDLYRTVSVNGYLSSDLTCIFVDQTQYEQYEQKFRFTLAHEAGHYVLHKDCYETVDWTSIADFTEFYQTVDQHEMSWFETQGHWFAEQVLVPKKQLVEVSTSVVRENVDHLRPLGELSEEAWSYLANEIAKPFNVSPAVIGYRIRRGRIHEEVRLEDFFEG